MKIPITPRLLACADFIRPGDRVADVGCDHGYLGIHLLKNGTAARILASDINEKPLLSARINAEKYGVSDKMSFFLSNGLQNLPRDFDVLVCAGMGADTMVSILEAAPWMKNPQYRMVLQCQTKTHLLRRYLSDHGWSIAREVTRRDGRFCYTVMEVLYAPETPRLTPGGCWFSPALLADLDEAGRAYVRWIYRELHKIVTSRGAACDPWMAQALEEVQGDPRFAFLKEDDQ